MTVKSLSQISGTAMQQLGAAEVSRVELAQDNPVVQIISDTLERLKACKPAWRNSLSSSREVIAWKREWTQAIARAGVVSQSQLDRGIAAAQMDPKPFMPSVGQFIQWCLGVENNDDQISEAFDRCRNKQPYADDVEYAAWLDVGFECRRLPIGKDFDLFKTVYLRKLAMAQRGERLPSRNVKMIANEAPSARDYVEYEINKRLADGNRQLTSIEQRMASLRQQNRTRGKSESFKYRRAANAR